MKTLHAMKYKGSKYRIQLSFCLFFYVMTLVQAQDDRSMINIVDSIQRYIEYDVVPSGIYHTLEMIYLDTFLQKKTKTIIDLCYKELALIDKDKSPEKFATLNYILAYLYRRGKSEYFNVDSTIHYLNILDNHTSSIRIQSQLEVFYLFTKFYLHLFSFNKAMDSCLKGIELAQTLNNYELLARFYNEMAYLSNVHLHDNDKVLEYSKKALDAAIASNDHNIIALCYMWYAGNATDYGQFKLAENSLDSCQKYISNSHDFYLLCDFLAERGFLNQEQGKLKEAEAFFKRSLAEAKIKNLQNRVQHVSGHLGDFYLKTGKFEEVLPLSQEILEKSADNLTLYELSMNTYNLYIAYKNLEKHDSALFYLEQSNFYQDSLDKIANLETVADLEQKYQTQEQQQQIAQQEREITHQQKTRRKIVGFLIVSLALVLALVALIWSVRQAYNNIKHKNQIIEEQTQELLKLDQLKSTFFANISHELRTPLTLILGPISSALKSGTLDNRNFTLLKKAQQSGDNLLKLIASILDLTKMEANRLDLDEQQTHLFSFISRLVSSFESYAEMQVITLSFQYQAKEDLQLKLDQNKLEIILNNLLFNAIKYNRSGGEVHLEIQDQKSQICIIVQDTGRGIHPQDLPKVFNRFYQSKQDHMPVEGGTGIGLALSQEYAKLMGGTIQVESELGKGSTFTLLLPRKAVLSSKVSTTIEEKENRIIQTEGMSVENTKLTATSKASILVVEDNSTLQDYLKMILSPYYSITTASNGKIAFDLLSESNDDFQLVLSDIMMPVMDGYQLLSALKADDRFRHIPCVMLTARADLQDRLKALRIGVDDYLLKPFEEEELLVRIENLLENRSARMEVLQEGQTEHNNSPIISEEDQIWLEQLEAKLIEEIGNPQYSIVSMAEDFAMSKSTLIRQIKRLTGMTPARYLKEIRLSTARQFLENKKFNTITQVAYEVGYTDVTAFTRAYKKHFKKLPSSLL